MTDMPCPSCGAASCWSSNGFRCCAACTGNHENDTYERFYPTEETNS